MMRKILGLVVVTMLLSVMGACQNGPSPVPQHTVTLSFTQAQVPTGGGAITKNCVYRGSVSGIYNLPALQCSTSPVTTFTDNTVANGVTYHYAVTASNSSGESAYSNDATAVIPSFLPPNAPSLLNGTEAMMQVPHIDMRDKQAFAQIGIADLKVQISQRK